MNKGQWVKPVLIVSLIVNLVFVGLVVGRFIVGPIQPPPLLWALHALPEESRHALRPMLRRQWADSRDVRKELHGVSKRVRVIVEAETLDEVALEASLAELRDVTGRFQIQIHETAVKLLETLPADQRRRIAGALLRPEPAQRPPSRGSHPPKSPEGPKPPMSPSSSNTAASAPVSDAENVEG